MAASIKHSSAADSSFSATGKTNWESEHSVSGLLVASNNLSDLSDIPTALANLGAGTVTSVSVTPNAGVSAVVANPTTTPALTFTLGAITPTSVSTGALTSSALTSSRVTFAGTSGLLSDSANLTWDNTNVKLTAQNTAGKTISAADTLMQITRSGAITNNTSTLANNALNLGNTCTSVGSQNVANIGSNITVSGADLNIGTAINSSGTGIFIGPSLPANQIICSLHSTSTASRQFLFNRTEIGITATDGTYFSVQSSGEFWINNQENQPLRLFIADYEQVRIAQTATADRYLILKGGLSSGSPANATIDVSGGALAVTPSTGFGINPTAIVHIKAGTAAASSAPNKIADGTRLTTAEVGVHEVESNHYLTNWKLLRFSIGGPIFDHFADVSNVTTGETDLYTDTLIANTFAINGDKVSGQYAGTFTGAVSSTQQLRAYFGGTLIFDSGALSIGVATDSWDLKIICVRESSSIIRCSATLTTNFATLSSYATYTKVTGLTLSGTNILKVTGQAGGLNAASNQITASLGSVEYRPAVN